MWCVRPHGAKSSNVKRKLPDKKQTSSKMSMCIKSTVPTSGQSGQKCAVTHRERSSPEAYDAQVIEVQLSVVKVEPRGGEHCCGQRGDLEESTSHQRHCGRRRTYVSNAFSQTVGSQSDGGGEEGAMCGNHLKVSRAATISREK